MAKDKKQPLILPAVEMTGIADKGLCVGRHEEGRVVFVENAAPGDIADVRVYKRTSGYYLASPVTFHRYSPDRVAPFCTHFGVCGGCKWQHLSYEAQLRHKTQVVYDAMQRIGKVEVGEWLPILGAGSDTFYRNKLEFTFSNKRWLTVEELEEGLQKDADVLGFHRPGAFDKAIDIEKCWLQPDPSNALRNGLKAIALAQGLSFFDLKNQHGLLRTLMLRITTLGEVMALVSFGESQPKKIKTFLEEVMRQFPQITTLCYCINTKSNDTIYDLDIVVHHGKGYVEELLGEVRFRIGPKSFFQTNTVQATRLYDVVVDFAQLQGHENVYDLYTGIGSIALYVARRCRRVVGIEEIAAAIDDARENAELNGINNAQFYAGDVRHMLTQEFAEQHGRPDLLITDPPRAGMHPDVVRMLLQLESPRIVYVSCNPSTQARDLLLLSEKYEVVKVQPVDMFPHTHHMESVALLQLKKCNFTHHMTSEEVPYTQVKTVLQPFIPALGQAADVILDQEVSAYPVFIVHQAILSMGIPLIENAAESEWSVNASTLEELVTKQIVQEDKLDVFRQVYKDPRTFLCLLVIEDSSANFVFLPR